MSQKKSKELQWGETPFHKMSPEELLRAAIRMYDACVSAKSALALCEANDKVRWPINPYWAEGTGGRALEKCRQVVDPIELRYSSEAIWRSFYRPAVDLLWKDNPPIILTTGWAICPKCGQMVGTSRRLHESAHGKVCKDAMSFSPDCDGILRPMTWEDMKIKEAVNGDPQH